MMADGTIWKQCECGHWTIHSSPLLPNVYPAASMYREDPMAPGRGFTIANLLRASLYFIAALLIWWLA
jgi:hypothetical protein